MTMSRSGLLERCSWWAQDGISWDETPGEAAALGTWLHRWAEDAIAGLRPQEPRDDDQRTMTEAIRRWIDAHAPGWIGRHVERKYAWDPAKQRGHEAMRASGPRDYEGAGFRDSWLAGTADLVVREDRGWTVYDWTLGRLERKLPQLRALALAVASAYHLSEVAIQALRFRREGIEESPRFELDAFDLALIGERLGARLRVVGTEPPNAGPWCDECWCPARAACEAYAARHDGGTIPVAWNYR